MTRLLVLREQLKLLCSKYEIYLIPIGKFLTAMFTFLIINGNIGYMEKLAKFPLVIIMALLCSFLPLNFIIIMAAGLTLAHLYALSLECAAVVGILFLLMFLLYFRFSPKDTFVVLFTPICGALGVPYAIPMTMGLIGSPSSVVSVGCGVVVYYILDYVKDCASALTALDAEGMTSKFKTVIDGVIGNKAMFVMIVAFAATIIIVYFIRRMNIDHSWTIAIIVGGLANILMLLVGDLVLVTNISIIGTILGSIFAFAFVKVLQFFVFNLDYTRTERVQFEDDEYYYYVKAVPKITIATPNKKVKKVSASKETAEERVVKRSSATVQRSENAVSRERKTASSQQARRADGVRSTTGTGEAMRDEMLKERAKRYVDNHSK